MPSTRAREQALAAHDDGEVRGEDGLLGFDREVLLAEEAVPGLHDCFRDHGMDRSNLGFEPSRFS